MFVGPSLMSLHKLCSTECELFINWKVWKTPTWAINSGNHVNNLMADWLVSNRFIFIPPVPGYWGRGRPDIRWKWRNGSLLFKYTQLTQYSYWSMYVVWKTIATTKNCWKARLFLLLSCLWDYVNSFLSVAFISLTIIKRLMNFVYRKYDLKWALEELFLIKPYKI